MIKTLATLIVIVSLLTAADSTDDSVLQTPEPKSESKARNLALEGTFLPVLCGSGIALFAQPHTGVALGGAGLLFGPSLGHFYAHQWGRGLISIGFRTAIVGMGIYGVYGAAAYEGDAMAIATGVAFGSALIGSIVYDFATAPASVRTYNAQIEKMSRMQLVPYIDLRNEKYGLVFVYRF